MKKVLGVIPARYASTRLPGKPLAKIKGKELIRWVYEGASQANKLDGLIVATDDQRIADCVTAFGGQFVMTSPEAPSGSDRIWEAIKNKDCDVVVNIQGDEPLVTGELVDSLIEPMLQEDLEMATLAHPLSYEELHNPNAVKVVVTKGHMALYFSRYPIPFSRVNASPGEEIFCALKHIGMYAYKKSFLEAFCAAPQAEIEIAESLEQLRALYLGAKIKVVQTQYRSWGVDVPDDIKTIEGLLEKKKN